MRRACACSVALIVALWSFHAAADPPASLRVVGSPEGCPSPAQLVKQLKSLLPHTKLRVAADGPSGDDVELADNGASFSVTIAGQKREFHDEQRVCADRARLGAVFVALVLDPLKVPDDKESSEDSGDRNETPEDATPTPPPAPPPKREQPAADDAPFDDSPRGLPWVRSELDFELGPAFQVAPGANSSNVPLLGGATARLRWGASLSLSLGAAAFLPATLHYEESAARVLWVPLDVSARIQGRSGDWEGGFELGPTAAFLRVEGQSVEQAQSTSRLDVGVRVAAIGRYWAGRKNALFASLYCSAFPRPYAFQVEGLGNVGETPTVWLGASLGLVMKAY